MRRRSKRKRPRGVKSPVYKDGLGRVHRYG